MLSNWEELGSLLIAELVLWVVWNLQGDMGSVEARDTDRLHGVAKVLDDSRSATDG